MSVGIHVSKNSKLYFKDGDKNTHKDMLIAIKNEVETFNMSALALFTVVPITTSRRSNMNYLAIKEYCKENDINIYTHTSYPSVGIWSVNNENSDHGKSQMWINVIKNQLIDGEKLGAKGVVLHVPRHSINVVRETMEVLSNSVIMQDLKKLSELPALTLEMPASRPDTVLTYETPEKLNTFVLSLHNDPKISINWNMCLDTCHLFAQGVSFRESRSWFNYEKKLSKLTVSKIKLIHLNGAFAKNFGTGKDGHVIPCSPEDAIWGHLISSEFRSFLDQADLTTLNKQNLATYLSAEEMENIKNSSLCEIANFAKKNNVTLICEIKSCDYRNTKFIMDLIQILIY
jgi:endonuclease IV